MASQPEAKKDESPRAQPSDFHLGEQVYARYRFHTPEKLERKHLVDPSFWAVIARQLRPGDVIECFAQDGTHYGELLVLAADRAYAKVHVLRWEALTTAEVSETQDYKIQWKGAQKKHCVIRAKDGEIIHEGEQTKEGAQQWLTEHEKVLTA